MRRFTIAAAAALGIGLLAAPAAQAQWGGPGYYGGGPGWVPPKIARKQAEKHDRIIAKYGRQPGMSYNYGGPPYGNAYGYRRNRGYDYDYAPRRYRESYGYRRDYW